MTFPKPCFGWRFYSMLAQQMTVNNITLIFEINSRHQWLSWRLLWLRCLLEGLLPWTNIPPLMPPSGRPALTCSSTTGFLKRHVKEEVKDFVMVPSRFWACGWRAGKTGLSLWLMIGNSEAEERERQDCATWIHNGAEFSENLKHALIWSKNPSFFSFWDQTQEPLIIKRNRKKCSSYQQGRG